MVLDLYRTEFIFLARSRFPTEDEQESEYRAELETYSPMPVRDEDTRYWWR